MIGEWLRCDDHIIEQTTFESVKTSDAYILVYSRCATNTVSSSIPSSKEKHPLRTLIEEDFDMYICVSVWFSLYDDEQLM
jgi:hypothetical protein